MDECAIDIFRPLPVVINDVYKSFFYSVYDWIRVALHLVCRYFFRLLCTVSLLLLLILIIIIIIIFYLVTVLLSFLPSGRINVFIIRLLLQRYITSFNVSSYREYFMLHRSTSVFIRWTAIVPIGRMYVTRIRLSYEGWTRSLGDVECAFVQWMPVMHTSFNIIVMFLY